MSKDTCKDKDCLNCPLPRCKYDKYTKDGQLDTSDKRPPRKKTGGKKKKTPEGMTYYQANRDECLRKERERYQKNREKKLAYQKEYNKRKKEEKLNEDRTD